MKIQMIAAAIAVLAAFTAPTHAATMWAEKDGPNNRMTVSIKGPISSGDANQFNTIVANFPPGSLVAISSPGGLMDEGLKIGQAIHQKQFKTLAIGKCLSMCATIWLAGTERFLYPYAIIGFHGVYTREEANAQNGIRKIIARISGDGNAQVIQFIKQLGFDEYVAHELTKESPSSFNLLTGQRPEQLGIKMTVIQPNSITVRLPLQPHMESPKAVGG